MLQQEMFDLHHDGPEVARKVRMALETRWSVINDGHTPIAQIMHLATFWCFASRALANTLV